MEFPKWSYGPNGEAAIFERAEDIPAGWQDAPFPGFHPDEPKSAPVAVEEPDYGPQNVEADEEDEGPSDADPDPGIPAPRRRGRPPKVRD